MSGLAFEFVEGVLGVWWVGGWWIPLEAACVHSHPSPLLHESVLLPSESPDHTARVIPPKPERIKMGGCT